MESAYTSHDVYTHIRIIIGLVLGLCLTRILSGVARFVQHPGRVKIYAVHMVWVLVVLVSAIHFWWWEFSLFRVDPWRFENFVFVLFYAFLFFLLASLLFPDDLSEYAGYEDYFMSRRMWFFGLFALTFIVDYVDTLMKGHARLAFLGTEYKIKIVLCVLLCGVAAWARDQRFHLAFVVTYLAYYIFWILRMFDYLD